MMSEAKRTTPDQFDVAILGTGIPGVAATINRLVHIVLKNEDGDPLTYVLVIDTRDVRYPALDAAYPLHGSSPRDLHPFYAAPPRGFPTFGEFIDGILEESPGAPAFDGALTAPTWGQIIEYMEFMMELAVRFVGDLAYLDFAKGPVREMREDRPNGPFTILLADGKRYRARTIVRARAPRYMAWPDPEARPVAPARPQERKPAPPPAAQAPLEQEVERALAKSGLPFEAVHGTFRARAGSRTIAVVAHDGSDDERIRARVNALVPRLLKLGYTELWLVTREVVGESLLETAAIDDKVQFLTLRELWSLTSPPVASRLRLAGGA
jgi:hypothetical protein